METTAKASPAFVWCSPPCSSFSNMSSVACKRSQEWGQQTKNGIGTSQKVNRVFLNPCLFVWLGVSLFLCLFGCLFVIVCLIVCLLETG